MPKIVDHDQRREELVRALWRIVARHGFDAASVRSVATESGWSVGAVRYYFGTQAELARFAMEAMADRIAERVGRSYRHEDGSPREVADQRARDARALDTLQQLLPLDDERRAEVLIWLEFMARARFDPSLDGPRTQSWLGERYLIRLAVADAIGHPLPAVGDLLPEPAEAAVLDLLLGLDGLTIQAVTYPEHWPPDAQRAAIVRLLQQATASATATARG